MHILDFSIQNSTLVSSDKSLSQKNLFRVAREGNRMQRHGSSVSLKSYGIQTSHRLTYPILIRLLSTVFLKMLVVSIISCTLYCEFSASMALIKSVFVVAGRSLQSSSFKLKLSTLNLCSRECIITLVKSTNLVCSIICTITFFCSFKTIKHNIPQILSLAIHIERCRKQFYKKFSPMKKL